MNHRKRLTVTSKWLKTKLLLKHAPLRPYMPKTKLMNESTLKDMLDEFQMAYVKPVVGTFGIGVIKVQKLAHKSQTSYRYQSGTQVRTFPDYPSMYQSLVKRKRKKGYLVQQGIRLLKYRGRRFDVRVMVQKNPKGAWEATGIIGRVAHPSKIVTNFHNGGTPMSVRTLLSPHSMRKGTLYLENHMKRVGVEAASALQQTYPNLNTIGADIGMDPSLTPWIIEVNTKPDPYIFKHLKDKSMFRKVYRYAKRLGRT